MAQLYARLEDREPQSPSEDKWLSTEWDTGEELPTWSITNIFYRKLRQTPSISPLLKSCSIILDNQ